MVSALLLLISASLKTASKVVQTNSVQTHQKDKDNLDEINHVDRERITFWENEDEKVNIPNDDYDDNYYISSGFDDIFQLHVSQAPSTSNAPSDPSVPSRQPSAFPSNMLTPAPSSNPSASPSTFSSQVPSSQPSIAFKPSKIPTMLLSDTPPTQPTKSIMPISNPRSSTFPIPSSKGPSSSPSFTPSALSRKNSMSSTPLFPAHHLTDVPSQTPTNLPTISLKPTFQNSGYSYAGATTNGDGGSAAKSGIRTNTVIVITCMSLMLLGVGLSYILRHARRRNAEKKLKSVTLSYHHQRRVSEYIEKADDDAYIVELEPKPINMSQDREAYERMILRSRHNLTVIMQANKQLQEESKTGTISDDRHSKSVQFKLNKSFSSYAGNSQCVKFAQDTHSCKESFSTNDRETKCVKFGLNGCPFEESPSKNEARLSSKVRSMVCNNNNDTTGVHMLGMESVQEDSLIHESHRIQDDDTFTTLSAESSLKSPVDGVIDLIPLGFQEVPDDANVSSQGDCENPPVTKSVDGVNKNQMLENDHSFFTNLFTRRF